MKIFHVIFVCTAIAILIYGIDDLILDVYYWSRMAYRRFAYRRRPSLTLEKLNSRPEQRVALMIPCWQESAVLGEMLANTVNMIQYENYDIFIGVYPNDKATRNAL